MFSKIFNLSIHASDAKINLSDSKISSSRVKIFYAGGLVSNEYLPINWDQIKSTFLENMAVKYRWPLQSSGSVRHLHGVVLTEKQKCFHTLNEKEG